MSLRSRCRMRTAVEPAFTCMSKTGGQSGSGSRAIPGLRKYSSMKSAAARAGVMARTSATSTAPSPVRSSPSRLSVWIVTPCLVAPPGSSGSSANPPSRATIARASSSMPCMPASRHGCGGRLGRRG